MRDIPKHIFCCEKLSRCAWQGFALHRGLAWGTILSTTSEWRERHAEYCGGRLIQFDLREAKGGEDDQVK
jgi:hypothetical protein